MILVVVGTMAAYLAWLRVDSSSGPPPSDGGDASGSSVDPGSGAPPSEGYLSGLGNVPSVHLVVLPSDVDPQRRPSRLQVTLRRYPPTY